MLIIAVALGAVVLMCVVLYGLMLVTQNREHRHL